MSEEKPPGARVVSESATRTNPLAPRTLRVCRSGRSYVNVRSNLGSQGGPYDPTASKDAGGTPASQLLRDYGAQVVQVVTNFAQHFGKSPDKLGPDQLRTYPEYLLKERRLAVHRSVDLESMLRRPVSKAGRSSAGGPRNHTTLSAL